MNILNIILSFALGVFIVISAYFIKIDANKKQQNTTPGYVSTKFSETNVRTGAGKDYPVIKVYIKQNIPLKVIDVYYEWYQIEDFEGSKGWVYRSLVKTQRTGIITQEVNVYIRPNITSKIIAIIKPDNLVLIKKCNELTRLCKVEFFVDDYNKRFSGWIQKDNIWGAVEKD